MGEDGEVVDGFAEGFKPLHCNARTQFDPAPVGDLNSVGDVVGSYHKRTMISEFINVLVAPVSKAKRTIISPSWAE
jgi:hypothetical protein